MLAVFQRNFSLENVATHTKAMTEMIINSRKSVPSWTIYCGKLVSLLINRTISTSFYMHKLMTLY